MGEDFSKILKSFISLEEIVFIIIEQSTFGIASTIVVLLTWGSRAVGLPDIIKAIKIDKP